MQDIFLLGSLMLAGAFPVVAQPAGEEAKSHQPVNFIYILADDLGYGDLSCYGQQRFTTPHIDSLASAGLRFTQHYAGCTVCAPSRSALMTGLHTGHTPIRGNREMEPEGQWPLPDVQQTLAELLRKQGYRTGAFGKWGLGYPGSEGDPLNQGFDEFFGYNCQRLAHHHYPHALWHNREQLILPENAGTAKGIFAPERIHQEALQFIRNTKSNPFFLYYATTIPHAELEAPAAFLAKNAGKYLPEKAYAGVDSGSQYRKGPYGSQAQPRAAFAGMVTLLDEQVGEIVKLLHDLGIDRQTMIIFTSDNGPHLEGGADPDYFNSNGPFRGYKRDLYEGGIRVPMIAYWPGTIKAGGTTGHVSAFWDVLPTLLEVAGATVPAGIDGISFLPVLLGKKQPKHKDLYWEFHEAGGKTALRAGPWKILQNGLNAPVPGRAELYRLDRDPGEHHNLALEHPRKLKILLERMHTSRTPSQDFPFGE